MNNNGIATVIYECDKETTPEFLKNFLEIIWQSRAIDCGKVITYQVKSGVTLDMRSGPIGPQIDLGADKYLPGDISLTQLDLFKGLNGIDRMNYIEPLLDTLKFLD